MTRRHVLCLYDGSPEAEVCVVIANRLAVAMDAGMTIASTARKPSPARPDGARLAEHDWMLAVAVPWSGDGGRLRRLVQAVPFPLLAVSPRVTPGALSASVSCVDDAVAIEVAGRLSSKRGRRELQFVELHGVGRPSDSNVIVAGRSEFEVGD